MTHTRDDIRQFVRSFISECCLLDPAELDDDEPLLSSQVLDSLGLMQLVAELSSKYEIDIDAGELTLENSDSVSQICDLVQSKLA